MREFSLIGQDGNVFMIIAYVRNAMRKCGLSNKEMDAYAEDAKSADYAHAIKVSQDMIDKLNNMDYQRTG